MSALDNSGLPLSALERAFAQFLQQAKPSADARHLWLAALVSHQFGRGHACLDLAQLAEDAGQTLGWDNVALASLPADLTSAAASLPWVQGASSPLVLAGKRLYLRRNWQAEQTIRASIQARLAQPGHSLETLTQALDQLFPDSVAALPDWQKVACALAARGNFTLITGGPGTGKTTTVVRLLALLQSQSDAPLHVALAAPTGKAAARLGESITRAVQRLPAAVQAHVPSQAQTLHKLLQVRASVQATAPPSLALDVVVVDEASMIDLELMARLMVAVPVGARLILLGDKDQLASVEAGAVMGQLCEGAQAGAYRPETVQWLAATTDQDVSAWSGVGTDLAQQTVMLRHSHRFAAGSAIGQWASAVNAGDRPAVAELYDAAPRWSAVQTASVTRIASGSAMQASLTALVRSGWQQWLKLMVAVSAPRAAPCSDEQALEALQAFAQFQVLCALREGPWGVLALNRMLAQALGFASEGWYAGRPVMVTRNDYNLELMNGDVGLCLATTRGLRVAFVGAETAQVRWVLPSRLDAVETVFAMTVHKSQGSEFDHVALVLPDKTAPVLTRELLYTGITRAKNKLTLVVPNDGVLRQATARKVWRSGGLGAALTDQMDADLPGLSALPGNMADHEN